MRIIAPFLQLLFPASCFGCGAKDVTVCNRCINLSRKSLSASHPYITTVFDFKDPFIRRAIHAIKYYHRRDLVRPLAAQLAEELRLLPDIKSYTLIPIPMPRMRRLLRGYNQAEAIADELGKALQLPMSNDVLIRVQHPIRQVMTKTRKERIKSQAGSFAINAKISGIKLLLIDDVTTTGATLEEARKVLLASHASSVRAATLAH